MKFHTELFCGVVLTMLGGLLSMTATAQQPASAAGTGSVSGHVTCADTQRPARFAHVVLFGVPAEVTDYKKPDPDADSTAQVMAMATAMKTLGKTNMVQVQTGTDGSYVATDVAPGDYYLFAAAPGYISPLNRVQAIFQMGADAKKPLPGVPIVHVTAEHATSADVTMDRGAAISGSISWDDGSPVSGAMMAVVPAKGDAAQPPTQFGMLAMAGMLSSLMNISDDQGHFRLSGLPPGDYLVQATIQAGQQSGLGAGMNLGKMMANKPLIVFGPAAFHKGDAKPVTLHTGEDRRDEEVTLNLGGLHSVSGRVTSAEDRHGINSATVKLQDVRDKDFVRSTAVDAVGGFTVTYVPAGTYTMKVSDAEDTEPAKKSDKDKDKPKLFGPDEKTIRSYQDGKLNVIVIDSDLTDQNIGLAVDKNPKATPDFGKLFGGDDDAKPKAQ